MKLPFDTYLTPEEARTYCTGLGNYKLAEPPTGVDPVQFVSDLVDIGKKLISAECLFMIIICTVPLERNSALP